MDVNTERYAANKFIDWHHLAQRLTEIDKILNKIGIYDDFYLKELQLENSILKEYFTILNKYLESKGITIKLANVDKNLF